MDQALASTTRRRGHQHHPRHATRRRLDASSRGPAQCGPAGKSAVATGETFHHVDSTTAATATTTTAASAASVATPTILTTATSASRLDCHAKNNNETLSSRVIAPEGGTRTAIASPGDKKKTATEVAKPNAGESGDEIITAKDGPKSARLRPARCGLPRVDDDNDYEDDDDDDEIRFDEPDDRLATSRRIEYDAFEKTRTADDKIVSRRSAGRAGGGGGARETRNAAARSRTKDCSGGSSPEPEHAVARARGDGNSDDETPNVEEDPELAELAKLRCPSERTEVQAEREARRRKRCADYPGLAFGSSIFSSDTMMKFSLIRNELKNIMGNQLKRVSTRATTTARQVPE